MTWTSKSRWTAYRRCAKCKAPEGAPCISLVGYGIRSMARAHPGRERIDGGKSGRPAGEFW